MPDPAPILQYATPPRLPPLWRASAVVLFIWGGLDISAGIAGAILAGFILLRVRERLAFLPGLFFAVFAMLLLYIGGNACRYGYRILRRDHRALRNACESTFAVEILIWCAAVFMVLVFVADSLHRSTGGTEYAEIFTCVIMLLLPLSLTLTRILLRRAARRLPPSANA